MSQRAALLLFVGLALLGLMTFLYLFWISVGWWWC